MKHFLSNNFSLSIDETKKLIRKESLDNIFVLPLAEQQKHYKKMKQIFGDYYVDTFFTYNQEDKLIAYSPLVHWELLCNLQNLNTPELKQLVDFQKKLIIFSLQEWPHFDFYGSDVEVKPSIFWLHKIQHFYKRLSKPRYSTNIIYDEQWNLRFVDTFLTSNCYNLNYKKYINFLLVLWSFCIQSSILIYRNTRNSNSKSIQDSMY